MRAILIVNPVSGLSALASNAGTQQGHEAQIVEALRAHDIEAVVCQTTLEDEGDGLARRAAAERTELVIAAGGDGTIHAVARGLIGTASTLAIIPAGTMNNIARSLEIPESIEEACAIIAHGGTSWIDVGKINGQIFLEVAGIGLEAVLFPPAEEIKSHGLLSTIRGIIDGLSALFAFQPTRFTISFDGRARRRYSAIQISICNTPYYGARFQFAPQAVMNDGLLDVLIYKNFSKLEYIRHAIAISQGRRPLEPKITRRKIKSMEITAEQPIEVHADGVALGHTPASIVVEPGVLRIRVPEKVAAGPNIMKTKLTLATHS